MLLDVLSRFNSFNSSKDSTKSSHRRGLSGPTGVCNTNHAILWKCCCDVLSMSFLYISRLYCDYCDLCSDLYCAEDKMSTILVTSQHTAAKMYQDTLGQDTVVYRLNLQHGLELAFQGKCRYKDGKEMGHIDDNITIIVPLLLILSTILLLKYY
ncbi:hypothetical protein M8J77_013433 [Diaphorina citri]|nr:hypothetical protein M8J77_013433 [Diaphorina citri]